MRDKQKQTSYIFRNPPNIQCPQAQVFNSNGALSIYTQTTHTRTHIHIRLITQQNKKIVSIRQTAAGQCFELYSRIKIISKQWRFIVHRNYMME